MTYNIRNFFLSFVFSVLAAPLIAQQYGPQFDNPGFENWTTREIVTIDEIKSVSEPVHWHSGGTATGTWSSMMPHSVEQSSHTRPGSSGSKSVKLTPSSVFGITANGTITNGRINAGSTSPSGSSNYDYTQRAQNAFNTPISQLPDSLTVWVCFRSASPTDKAQVKAVVHGDADYKVIANGTEEPANMHVATADLRFTRTAPAGGNYTWNRLSIPFVNSGPCTDVRYILFIANTNETPGTGSTSDDLFVDDVLLVYTPTLALGQLTSTNYAPNDAITIPFTLTGTMSPDNLNASANQVIAELSDANGSFNNPTVLGTVTTNTSGSITATIPNVVDGQYQIRVRSTNYPMIGQNIQTLSIASPIQTYIVNIAANPIEGGSVTGGGEYQQGQSCTVTATPNTNYTFTNWTENGNVVSTNASYTFTVNGNRSLVANFTYVPPTYTVTVSANPTNGGVVTGGGPYTQGASCTVAATANEGYTFINWTENGNQVSTQASYTFTVQGNRSLVANFQIQNYNITASADPTAGGNVTGGGTYNYGQSCTLTASANTGYTFVNWTKNGTQVSTNPSYTFTVTESAAYVAHFQINSYNVIVSADPTEGGIASGSGTFNYGQSCTVYATANEGYTFINWTENGNQVSTQSSYTFTVQGNRNLVANFSTQSYIITATSHPENGGVITGSGGYNYGDVCTLTATANYEFLFLEWTKDGVQVSTEPTFTFTVTESEEYVAHFLSTEGIGESLTSCQIFPNPFASTVSIKAEKVIKSISVYDIYGRLVRKQGIADKAIDLDLNVLEDGTYLLILDYGDNRSAHRIVKTAR